jgi:hypothetical protein
MCRHMNRLLSLSLSVALVPGLSLAEPRSAPRPTSSSDRAIRQAEPDSQAEGSRDRRREANPSHRSEHREEFRRMFRIYSPYRAEKLEKEARRNPAKYQSLARHIGTRMREMERLRRTDMAEYRRQMEIMRLEDRIEKLTDEGRAARSPRDRERIREELARHLEELFDRKEEAQRARIERMDKELGRMKDKLDRRRQNRPQLIKRRLHQLTEKKTGEKGL